MTIIADSHLTSEDVYHDGPYIEIQSGLWYLYKPHFLVSDVAHNTAQINRYTGAANFPYSVAEHQVLVSLLMELEFGGDPYEGLFHDRGEAYINDLSSPVKGELPDYKRLEKHIELVSAPVFGVPEVKSEECKKADFVALFLEAYQLMPSKGTHYKDPYNYRPIALELRARGWMIHGYDWITARDMFLARERELSHRRARSAQSR